MSLVALIAVYEDSPEGLGPRSLAPLAGLPLIEHQARRAVAAGADRLLLLIDQRPPAIDAALAHLRSDGVQVKLAEGLAAAAEDVAPDERILLIADGCLPDQTLLDEVAAAAVPSIGIVTDGPGRDAYERIDAAARWAGLALLDGSRLIATAGMIGEWDAVSTLLRRLVQENAPRIDAGARLPLIGIDPAAIASIEQKLIRGSRRKAEGWAERWIVAPLVEQAVPLLARWRADPRFILWGGAVLALAGGLIAPISAIGGLASWLVGGLGTASGLRLALLQARGLWSAKLAEGAVLLGGAVLLAGIARLDQIVDGQWGWWLVAAFIPAALAFDRTERPLASHLAAGPPPPWRATPVSLGWALLPFGLAGYWRLGLILLALYAAATVAERRRATLRALP